MATLKINKLEAARRQLETAIRMHFEGRDIIAVHTLVMAASRILRDLCARSGDSALLESEKRIIRPGKEKAFYRAISKAANFSKHADEDPDDELEIEDCLNDFAIVIACQLFGDLVANVSVPIRAYFGWFSAMYPDLLLDGHPSKPQFASAEYDWLRSAPRHEQLHFGIQVLNSGRS